MKLIELARFVDDVPATASFYTLLLGCPPSYQDDGIATFDVEGMTVLIHRRYEPGPDDLPCEDHVAFGVPDLDEAIEKLAALGMQIAFPPRDYDWGRSAYLRDPEGKLVELAQQGPVCHPQL